MTLLKILGIDRYTAKFKEWIRNKFIAKGGLKTINNQSIEGKGNIVIENWSGGSSVTPDWNAKEGEAGYIKNRTHYTQETSISTSTITYIEDFPKYYDDETERYYSKQDVNILYTEDGNDYLLTIPAYTLLGYENNTNGVDIEINFGGEVFQFESYSDTGDIYIKVKQPNAGDNFRVVLYNQLDEKFIPDTIARKSDLENIGGGKSKFQLYKENGGTFFTDENVYNIFDALRNESLEYYTDLIIDEILTTDRYYSFSELGINYRNLLGVIYSGKKVDIYLGQDDYAYLNTPGECKDTSMYFENEVFCMYINIIEQTLILNIKVA